jgi:hypothetical protein
MKIQKYSVSSPGDLFVRNELNCCHFVYYKGMFVGRATPLGIDPKASSLYSDFQKYPPMPRAVTLPCDLMIEHVTRGGVELDEIVGKADQA